MKKLFLLALLPLVLSSCNQNKPSTGIFWEQYYNNSSSFLAISRNVSNFDTSFDTTSFQNAMNNCKSVISNKLPIQMLAQNYSYVNDNFYSLIDTLRINHIYYYANNDQAKYTKYMELYNLYLTIFPWNYDVCKASYEAGGDYRYYFFGNKTDAECLKELEEMKSTDRETELDTLMEEISNDMIQNVSYYQSLSIDQGYETVSEKYISYINYGKEYAEINGYDNYLTYLYKEVFGRDYTLDQAHSYSDYVKKYIVPKVQEINSSSASYKDILSRSNYVRNFCNQNIANVSTSAAEMFDKFATYMGSDYRHIYDNTWNTGYYYFTNNSKSLGTAYTANMYTVDDDALYFSSSRQDALTVLHEFGHHYSNMINKDNKNSMMDIAETYSQAHELLYLTFYKTYCDSESISIDMNDYRKYEIFSIMKYMIEYAVINEIELYAYTAKDLTKETLAQKVKDIIKTYNGTCSEKYWYYPCVASAGYYISYGTSATGALQFDRAAQTSLDSAKSAYISLATKYKENDGLAASYNRIGLTSPLEEMTYQEIVQIL